MASSSDIVRSYTGEKRADGGDGSEEDGWSGQRDQLQERGEDGRRRRMERPKYDACIFGTTSSVFPSSMGNLSVDDSPGAALSVGIEGSKPGIHG
jgi:hypothetical protein